MEKNYIIILIDGEKAFDKNQHPFTIITWQIRNRKQCPPPGKGHYEKPSTNITYSIAKYCMLFSKIRKEARMSVLDTFFFFLAAPAACGSSWARDQTCAAVAACATAVAKKRKPVMP